MLTIRRIIWATVTLAVLAVGCTAAVLWSEGYRVYVIHTGSMTPTYRPGDIVIDRPASGGYRPGEVITFRHSDLTTDVVTHRITDITPAGLIHTKGDANASADVWDIRPNQVQGSTMFGVRRLGYAMIFLKQPAGIAALATTVFGVLLLWSFFFPPVPDEPTVRRSAHRTGGRGAHRPPELA